MLHQHPAEQFLGDNKGLGPVLAGKKRLAAPPLDELGQIIVVGEAKLRSRGLAAPSECAASPQN